MPEDVAHGRDLRAPNGSPNIGDEMALAKSTTTKNLSASPLLALFWIVGSFAAGRGLRPHKRGSPNALKVLRSAAFAAERATNALLGA